MDRGHLTGNWNAGNNKVTVNLPVMYFEEDGVHIAYIPVLDISGYGQTPKESVESLAVALDDYFSYTMAKKTLIEDLKQHGWTVRKKTKPYVAPDVTDILQKNEYLHNIVNTKPYTMDRINVDIPQYA